MNELALFAGAGGGLLGSKLLGWRTVCAVEINPYCRRVLMQRQNDGVLEPFPIWDDVGTFDGTAWNGIVDVVSAGFPCQPFSVAGDQLAADDERNMWPETIRVLREVRPEFALLENVPGLVRHDYFGEVLSDLAGAGFDAEWDALPAGSLGAHFYGERLYVVASRAPSSGRRWQGRWSPALGKNQWRRDEFERLVRLEVEHGVPAGSLGRVSDGVSCRMDRLKAAGNAQSPIVVATAWRLLTGEQ